MFALELKARLENRDGKPRFGAQMLQYLAKLNRPARVPYDYREIEKVKAELERKKLHATMITRFKAM